MKYHHITILLLFLLGAAFTTHAQDTLYRVNGKKQVVKVLEINSKQIKYKNGDGQSGPVFVLNKSEVVKIVYADGTVEKMDNTAIVEEDWGPAKKPDPISKNFKRRYINFSIPDFFTGSLTFGYEYFDKTGDYSIRVPLSVGLQTIGLTKYTTNEYESDVQAYYRENKIMSTGFDCYYYPNGQGRVKYYIGPSIEIGWFKYTDYLDFTTPGASTTEEQNGNFQSVLLQNGFLFQPTPELNFNLGLGLGYCRSRYIHRDLRNTQPGGDYYVSKDAEFAARFVVNVGYKFN